MKLTAEQVGRPVHNVPAAVKRLTALGGMREAADRDGLRHFNRLYLDVTTSIQDRLAAPSPPRFFRDRPFLRALDVAFANRYFDAVASAMAGRPASGPWQALFDRRRKSGVLDVQFAIAGVNVHINYDLAHALVTAWDRYAHRDGDHQRYDYDQVNAVFGDLYYPFRQTLLAEMARIDKGGLRKALDDASAFLVVGTRREAWEDATVLARARSGRPYAKQWAEAHRMTMAGTVTLTTKGLLRRLG